MRTATLLLLSSFCFAGCGTGEIPAEQETPDSLRNTIHTQELGVGPDDINRGYYIRNGDTVPIQAGTSAPTIGPAQKKPELENK